jgi:hypothetical protein
MKSEYNKKYYLANKEKLNAQSRAYRTANLEKIKEQKATRKERNSELNKALTDEDKLREEMKECEKNCSDYSCVRGGGCSGAAYHAWRSFLRDQREEKRIANLSDDLLKVEAYRKKAKMTTPLTDEELEHVRKNRSESPFVAGETAWKGLSYRLLATIDALKASVKWLEDLDLESRRCESILRERAEKAERQAAALRNKIWNLSASFAEYVKRTGAPLRSDLVILYQSSVGEAVDATYDDNAGADFFTLEQVRKMIFLAYLEGRGPQPDGTTNVINSDAVIERVRKGGA